MHQRNEQMRDLWIFAALEALLQDCRYACRSLRKSPGFLAVVVLSLALGIAANSTIFSVLDAEVYRPLPYEQPGRLMAIWQMVRGHPDSEEGPAIAEGVDWNQQTHAFEEIAQTSGRGAAPVSQLGAPEIVDVQYVTPNFFHVLRVRPEAGRIFTAAEAQDQVQTVVIGDAFAKRHFQSASKALGKTFGLDGVESTVVGVMPASFTDFDGERIDVWQPINPASARYVARNDSGWLMPVGRLKPGISIAQAQQDMAMIAQRMERAYPAVDKGRVDHVVPLQQAISSWARTLYPFFGAVGFVLLIACLNVANLLQSRSETRRREKAVRASLGASRARLIQQLLVESGLLAFGGGALGLALTYAGIKLFVSMATWFPNTAAIRIDVRVVLFTALISIASALLFGMAPAWQSSNPDLNTVLREGDRRTVAGSRRRVRQAFVVAEIALAMVLLVGAGLMIRTIFRLAQVNLGYDPNNLVMASIALPEAGKYVDLSGAHDMQRATPAVDLFYRRLLEGVAALPGVESAATMSRMFRLDTFSVLGRGEPQQRREAGYQEVSADFFRTLRIPLKSGRYIDESDGPHGPWVAVVNEAFAKRYFPHENPVGQRLLMRYEPYHVDEDRPRQIVGVVGDCKYYGRTEKVPPTVFSSFRQQSGLYPGGTITAHVLQQVFVRTAPGLNTSQVGAELQKVTAKIDPDQPVTGIVSMKQFMADSMAHTEFITHLLEIFAGAALLLAAIGIYGVMSYFVNERTHEIGIRIALGAARAQVVGMIAMFGFRLALTGLVLGTALALALTRLMNSFLSGVSATDPPTFVATAGALLAVALFACYVPGRRATRVDPMVALRHE